jgi:transposase
MHPRQVTAEAFEESVVAAVVERCFNRLEQYRAIATRYDKTATRPTAAC